MQENDQNLLTTRAQLAVALSDAHRNKSLLDATIKSTASGVVVCDLDVNFIFINPAGRRMLGKIAELGPEHWSDSLGLFESEDGRLFDETELPLGRACRGENVDRMEILIRNGISDQPRWLEANATQILDLDDQPIGAVTVFNDSVHMDIKLRQRHTFCKSVDTVVRPDNTRHDTGYCIIFSTRPWT